MGGSLLLASKTGPKQRLPGNWEWSTMMPTEHTPKQIWKGMDNVNFGVNQKSDAIVGPIYFFNRN
jgi:hypothetical protein